MVVHEWEGEEAGYGRAVPFISTFPHLHIPDERLETEDIT